MLTAVPVHSFTQVSKKAAEIIAFHAEKLFHLFQAQMIQSDIISLIYTLLQIIKSLPWGQLLIFINLSPTCLSIISGKGQIKQFVTCQKRDAET